MINSSALIILNFDVMVGFSITMNHDIMTSLFLDAKGVIMAKHKQTDKPQKQDKENKKKNTSLRLSAKTLKSLKIRAIEEDTSIQKIIEDLVEQYLDSPRKIPNDPS